MKHTWIFLLIMVTVFSILTASAQIPSMVSIGDFTLDKDATTTAPIQIQVNDASGLGSATIELTYNSGVVKVLQVINGEFDSMTPNINNVNGITNIVLTNLNLISASTETPAINIAFNITGGSGSSTSLDMQNVEFSDAGFNPYTPPVVVDGQITVGIKGDFNNNGNVDISDLATVAFMVAGKVPEDLNADFNGNGRVDIGDAAKIALYLAGKVSEL